MKKTLLIILIFIGASSAAPLQAQEIKALSINIHANSDTPSDSDNAWTKRRKAFARMITTEHPDVIAVQEALLDQLSYIDRIFRNEYRRVGFASDNGLARGFYTAILYDYSKLELVSHRTRWLSNTPQRVSKGWDAEGLRIFTMAKFRVKATGKEFYYINTQLDDKGTSARKNSIILIKGYIDLFVEKGVPVIVGGDMNVEANSDIFTPLLEAGLSHARTSAQITNNKESFNGFGISKPCTIDHIFTRDIVVKKFITLTRKYGVRFISDHYPIGIVFDL